MRVDEDDVIYREVKPRKETNWLAWVGVIAIGVCLGGLLHDGARILAARVVLEYQLREFQQIRQETNQQIQQQTQSRQREEQAKRQAAAALKRLDSDLCRFWTEQDRNEPSERSRAEKAKNC